MNKKKLLTSAAAGAMLGALVFGSTPALSQMFVVDWASIAVQNALKVLQDQISNTLTSISGQLGLSGPIGSLLGSSENGTVTQLLQQGFTQEANYAKASVDAQQQIVDGALISHTRVLRDFRNSQIGVEHTTSPVHCQALDNGQAVTVGAGQSWKVAQSIEDVGDQRGEAANGQPAYVGRAQAVAAISQLHFARYCSATEAAAGLCTASSTQNADQRASTLFGTGTLSGQDGVTAANDFVTNAIQPIVPAALRAEQLTSEIGREAATKRREYNARMSLARNVLDYAVAVQSPSVPLSTAQKQQMQNEGLTPIDTGSWLQALMLDANRRYSDVDWAAQLQAMPPASVAREIAHELAATNYLLTQLYRVSLLNASANATHLAATTEANFVPTVQLPTPNMSN